MAAMPFVNSKEGRSFQTVGFLLGFPETSGTGRGGLCGEKSGAARGQATALTRAYRALAMDQARMNGLQFVVFFSFFSPPWVLPLKQAHYG